MSNIDKQALREAAERAASDSWGYDRDEFNDALTTDTVLALLDELEAAEKRIAELEKSHAQVIQGRYHYKRMCDEGFRRINKGINLSINDEG
ncbi:ead/Ea22-like family protein [Enterobacter hormaechei]|uniref:ead/Ea22-like family protein n=1 Tax=Enterobacter hormaechei TaxID=158836 RepID=UPI001F0B42CD|nr:ead/Ea22-like family protein [Enterobacter hormaechei]